MDAAGREHAAECPPRHPPVDRRPAGQNEAMGFEPDGFSTSFGVLSGLVVGVVIVGFVVIIALTIRNAARVRNSGHDPLSLQTDLAVKLLDSEALTPAKSLESRLLELDALLTKGTITSDEHAAARARLLGG